LRSVQRRWHRRRQDMPQDQPRSFQIAFITDEAPSPIESVSAVLAQARSSPRCDGGSITPVDGQFPCLWVEWHSCLGFVIQCYEDESSPGDFLVSGSCCGIPKVEIELGGQALELWPSELFVSDELAEQALKCFIATGRQNPDLNWVRIDAFPRTILWEGRVGREAWERNKNERKERMAYLRGTTSIWSDVQSCARLGTRRRGWLGREWLG